MSKFGALSQERLSSFTRASTIYRLGSCRSDDERTDTQLPLLVTASVDAIHLRRRLDLHQDVQVSGQVVWTGKSAMDIRMQLNQVHSCTYCSAFAVRPILAHHLSMS